VKSTHEDVAAGRELASWGRRLAALLVDGAILGGIVVVTLLAAGVPLEDINATIRDGGNSLALILLFVLPKAIYDTALIGSRNQTFGKMALHIQVVDETDRATPIGYARAFTRWLSTAFLWALFTVPGVLDHLWPLRDSRRQTFHDKFARSVVVRT
jgi:uncharacterized RDD family membrane protein YckC